MGLEFVIGSGQLAGRVDEAGIVLPRQEGHDLSDVDWQADVFGGGQRRDRGGQAVSVDFDPVGVVGRSGINQQRIQ